MFQITAEMDPFLNMTPILYSHPPDNAISICPKCGDKNVLHPTYLSLGLWACAGKGRCRSRLELCKEIVALRGWKFIEYIPYKKGSNSKSKIRYLKSNSIGHVCLITLDSIVCGGQCKECAIEASRTGD